MDEDEPEFDFEITPLGVEYLAERKRLLGMSRPLTEEEESFLDDCNYFLDKQGK